MREGFKKLIMGILAFALVMSVAAGVNSKVDAAVAANVILLDETGAIIGECSGASNITESSPVFVGATFDAGKTASDVAIILCKDPMGCYIVTDICPNTTAGQKMTDVVLPYPDEAKKDSYQGLYGLAIEGIGSDLEKVKSYAFAGSTTLKTVKIPSTVGRISEKAFSGCTSLTSVEVSKLKDEEIRLNSYGTGIFDGCTNLKSFTIPCPKDVDITFSSAGTFTNSFVETVTFASGITKIPDSAMLNASYLKTVNYGNNVTAIGKSSFKACTSLSNIELKGTITSIGASAFEGCTALKNITLPDNLNEIGSNAFKSSGLVSITIPGLVQTIGSNAFATDSLKSATFAQCKNSSDKRIVIPANAMSGAKKLTSVTWPDTVTEIGAKAFYQTASLTSVEGLQRIKVFGASAFQESNLTGTVDLDSVVSIGSSVFAECANLSEITFGGSLEEIGTTFLKNTAVSQVILPNSLAKCTGKPFGDAPALVSATYLGTNIPANIFNSAKTLKTIKLNEDAVSVGDNAFTDCYCFTNNISFAKVTSFGKSAFKGCYSLNNPIDVSSATKFGASCFEKDIKILTGDASLLKDIAKYKTDDILDIKFTGSFNQKITEIGASAFKGCYYMTLPVVITQSDELNIGSSAFTGARVPRVELVNAKKIGDYAFSYNSNMSSSNKEYMYYSFTPLELSSILLSGGEKATIGNSAFYGAENVTEFDISNADIDKIGEFAFYNIHQIPVLILPAKVTTLLGGCFGGWSITDLTIPSTVKTASVVENSRTSLLHGPFTICKNLQNIVFADGIATIPSCLFYHVQNQDEATLNITIPASVAKVGDNYPAFGANVVKTVNLTINGNPNAQEIGETIKKQFVAGNENVDVDITINEGVEFGWLELDGKNYWYENSTRQGTYDDPQGVVGDGTVRGREIYDPSSDGWYWLDAVYNGAKAVNKEVWMPYIYQGETQWSDSDIEMISTMSGDMANQVVQSIKDRSGKWVRYDANGKMYKGWYTVAGNDALIYPDQAGNTYYYDQMTGLMAKGIVTIDGKTYEFDQMTGVLLGER